MDQGSTSDVKLIVPSAAEFQVRYFRYLLRINAVMINSNKKRSSIFYE
jgi:hypothetical protein